ncbi:hypothetical protein HZH68_014625 [Vespula germanica]|uniref:H15 domain-containing protein n=1 Tax=Vespula germanica TaxID=30212 RepID=A0A834MUW5_VESGE|nr:hypothetical protein HZH68_014625 [Vespula germanica]
MAEKTSSSPVVIAGSGTGSSANQQTNTSTSQSRRNMVPKTKKPRSKPTHPRTPDMVTAAIKALKERNGSSLQAIKKYMSTTYKLDIEKHAPFIRKYLKSAVASGALVQTKGKGAAGSFRLASLKSETTKSKSKKSRTKKQVAKKQTKKTTSSKKASTASTKTIASTAAAAAAAVTTTAAITATTTSGKKSPVKKPAVTAAVSEKRKTAKGPAAKPPKAKSAVHQIWSKSKVTKATPKKQAVKKATTAKPKKATTKKSLPPTSLSSSSQCIIEITFERSKEYHSGLLEWALEHKHRAKSTTRERQSHVTMSIRNYSAEARDDTDARYHCHISYLYHSIIYQHFRFSYHHFPLPQN